MGKNARVPVLVCFLCIFCFTAFAGCSPGSQDLVGTYKAQTRDPSLHGKVSMNLRDTGAGIWSVGDSEIAFTWHVKGNELRLYTRNGGIIVGQIKGRDIEIALPGLDKLSFKKVKRAGQD